MCIRDSLGAGGAATAILVQAALDGVREISVFLRPSSRFYDRARETAEALERKTGCIITLCDFSDHDRLRSELSQSRILTNATSLGMAPSEDACPIQMCIRDSPDPGLQPPIRLMKPGQEYCLVIAAAPQGHDGLELFHPFNDLCCSKGRSQAEAA